MSTSSVIVVGGGVIGCAIAYELARAGVSVTVIERERIGAEASSAAAGMLAPFAESTRPGPLIDLGLRSMARFATLAPELREATGVDIELRPCGSLRVALDEAQEVALRLAYRWQRGQGVAVEWLDPAAAREREPALGERIRGALACSAEQQVRPRRLVAALAQAAGRLGVRFVEGTPVLGLVEQGQRVTGIRTPGAVLGADAVVLAAGPWSGGSEWLGYELPIMPKRGQILRLHMTPQPLSHIVASGHHYLVPRADGTIVLGGTEEDSGFDRRPSAAGVAYLLGILPSLAPALARAELRSIQVGLRPWSADGLPLLGRVPGRDGLIVASGHGRNGILLSAITAEFIARLLIEGRDAIPAACQVGRIAPDATRAAPLTPVEAAHLPATNGARSEALRPSPPL